MALQLFRRNEAKHNVYHCSFLFTIPLYFVLDGVNKFWGFVPLQAVSMIFLTAVLCATLSVIVLRRFFSIESALLISIWLMLNYFYFKTLKKNLVNWALLFYQYKYYLLLLFFLTALLLILLKRSSIHGRKKWLSYVNTLFILLVAIEIYKSVANISVGEQKKVYTEGITFSRVVNTSRPNVYFLVMDEYQGVYTTKKFFNFSNESFVNALRYRSFFVPQKPVSNYNATPFSVLSTLDMGYIMGYNDEDVESEIAFSMCIKALKHNSLFHFFSEEGYAVVNNSFFPIENAGIIRQLFLPTEERLLLDKTFGSVLINDFFAAAPLGNEFHFFIKDRPARTDIYNQKVLKQTREVIKERSGSLFMYSHFMMPHFPYLRDSAGDLRNLGEAYSESNRGRKMESYINYLKYCNKVMLEIIDKILISDKNAIIVLASDHGLREAPVGDAYFNEFNNFLAVRTPDNHYAGFSDSISMVNVFRLLLNNQFQQKMPLLNDSLINVKLFHRSK